MIGSDWCRECIVASSSVAEAGAGAGASFESAEVESTAAVEGGSSPAAVVLARSRPRSFEGAGFSVVIPRNLLRNAVRMRKQSSLSQNERNV
jgi:hypothetical protein